MRDAFDDIPYDWREIQTVMANDRGRFETSLMAGNSQGSSARTWSGPSLAWA